MISMLIGTIGSIVAIAGWFGFHSAIAVFIGFGMYLLETLMEITGLSGGAIALELVIFVVGCLASGFFGIAWYICGMLASSFYSLIVGIVGIIAVAARSRY